MSQQVRLTVLIPCHSLEYLEQAIGSVDAQTLSKEVFDVILVADRVSVSETSRILEKFHLNYTIIDSHKPGIVPALNLGLSRIKSEYVARMDEDDVMMPNRLEMQLKFLDNNPNVIAVGGQLQLINHNNEIIGSAKYRGKVKLKDSHLFMSTPIAHPASMIRLNKIIEIGGYRDFLPEDWDLWVRLRELGAIANLHETVLKYRIHPNQLTRLKMYEQSLGRSYVAASHYARKFNLKDCPSSNQTNTKWLDEAQEQLRKASIEYVNHENKYSKFERLIKEFEYKFTQKQVITFIKLAIYFPNFFITTINRKVVTKFKNFFG
jgi:glycosyltransferase involved in cell wall biosynthesis